jgi:SAM-dependent methyltransferase
MHGQVLAQLRPHLRPGLKVLDLGCDRGGVSLYMARAGCEVLGIDLARNAVEVAQRGAVEQELPNAHFAALDFVRDWNEPAAFDFIHSSFVLEHVPDDQGFMDKVALALKPGGELLLLTGARYSSAAWVGRYLPWLCIGDREVGHFRRYSGTGLRKLMSAAGLVVERTAFLDSALREWTILCKPIRRIQRLWGLPGIRSAFNSLDAALAHFAFPGTVAVHCRKPAEAVPEAAPR